MKPGDELLVTYVNPEMGVRSRRRELEGWGFGECVCSRCVAEVRLLKESGNTGMEGDGEWEMEGLAVELKAGLGVT